MDNITLHQNIKKHRKSLSTKERQYRAFLASLHLTKLLPFLPKNAKIDFYLDDFGELPTAPILAFYQKYGFMPYSPITRQNQALLFAPCFYDLTKTPLKKHPNGG